MERQEDFKLHIASDKDKRAFDEILKMIFHYTTYHKKEGIYILDLIAKNKCGKILENYFMSLSDIQKMGIFYTAVESNCVELVNFMIDMQINIQPHRIKELTDIARRGNYFEMLKLLEKAFPSKK